jgi:hypothetical protein
MMKLFVLGIMVAGIVLMVGCRAEPLDPDRVIPPTENMDNQDQQQENTPVGDTIIPREGDTQNTGRITEESGMTVEEVTYVGQIDNNSIETKLTNGQEEEFMVFRLSEEVKEKFQQEDLEEGDQIRVQYRVEDNQANVLYNFERRNESAM